MLLPLLHPPSGSPEDGKLTRNDIIIVERTIERIVSSCALGERWGTVTVSVSIMEGRRKPYRRRRGERIVRNPPEAAVLRALYELNNPSNP